MFAPLVQKNLSLKFLFLINTSTKIWTLCEKFWISNETYYDTLPANWPTQLNHFV